MQPAQRPWRPTREQIAAAAGRTVPDVVSPGVRLLFCGINPGLYSGAVGHHFARPGNRFWKALHAAGLTPRLLSPFEEHRLPSLGMGITNLVDRATASAGELGTHELRDGARRLEEKVGTYRPVSVAILGLTAYRVAFERPRAAVGQQPDDIAGAAAWVLPNPSGLNAHYRLEDFAELFGRLSADGPVGNADGGA